VTYDAVGANLTTNNSFWLNGGGADLNATISHGFGVQASLMGLHTANSGGNVPVNLFVETFGPCYTVGSHFGTHAVAVSVHGLVGEANGFDGLYPTPRGADSGANGLAVQAGGNFDIGVGHRLAVRVIEADWLRTQLPNSTTNVQNNLRLGAGIVFRLRKK
jgi:peptidoglycan-associated lipoprotein